LYDKFTSKKGLNKVTPVRLLNPVAVQKEGGFEYILKKEPQF